MTHLILYHTAGCHLCEEAEALISACLSSRGLNPLILRKTDVADDPALFECYGVSIPVLCEAASGRELNWPFGTAEIQEFLG